MSLVWPNKDPDELLDYSVDWTSALGTLTITNVAWSVRSTRYATEVPLAAGNTMTFGSAIHAALDELYNSSRSVGSSEDAIDILRNTFTQKMKASRESFTDANFERRIFYGNTILSKYYK